MFRQLIVEIELRVEIDAGIEMPEATRTIAELRDELTRFEAEARRVGLAENSIHTYVDRAESSS